EVMGVVVEGDARRYAGHYRAVKPDADLRLRRLPNWDAAREWVEAKARSDDLVVLVSARRGAISWHPALARLPGMLRDLGAESFLVIFPSELDRRQRDGEPHANLTGAIESDIPPGGGGQFDQ